MPPSPKTHLFIIIVCLALILSLTACEWMFAEYWLTVSIKEGQGTTNPAVGRHGPYSYDQVIAVSATPTSGWRLKNMVEDHDGDTSEHNTSPAEVKMDRRSQEVKVDVYFEEDIPTYYVSVSKYLVDTQTACEGTVTLSPTEGDYNQGTTVTITCTAAPGMTFVKMVIYGETSEGRWVLLKTVDSSTTTIDVDYNIAVEAHFTN